MPGMLISTEDAVGGFPILNVGVPCVDTDQDVIPDTWEMANGLGQNNPADGSLLHGTGYSNLERFLSPQTDSYPLLNQPVLQIFLKT